jgi:hypothetical protein
MSLDGEMNVFGDDPDRPAGLNDDRDVPGPSRRGPGRGPPRPPGAGGDVAAGREASEDRDEGA